MNCLQLDMKSFLIPALIVSGGMVTNSSSGIGTPYFAFIVWLGIHQSTNVGRFTEYSDV